MNEDRRDQFLLHLYDNLWDSIDRSESGVWQFVGLNAALFAVIALMWTEQLPKDVAGFIGLVIVFWGINIVLNAGWWFNHNLNFVRNIELHFLTKQDYGRIWPIAYRTTRARTINTLNLVHLVAFIGLGIGLLFLTGLSSRIIAFTVVGIAITTFHYLRSRQRLMEFVAGTTPVANDLMKD